MERALRAELGRISEENEKLWAEVQNWRGAEHGAEAPTMIVAPGETPETRVQKMEEEKVKLGFWPTISFALTCPTLPVALSVSVSGTLHQQPFPTCFRP